MKRNIMLLSDQVKTALEKKCVSAIVAEAFINALPFDSDEVAKEASNLARYSSTLVSKMHPETLLSKAAEATINDPKASLFVKNLRDSLSVVIEAATKRIVTECGNSSQSNSEIIEAIKLNDEETDKLVEASKKSGIDAVSNLVKEKVIDVIKDEKNAYETSLKMREEIKEIINEPSESLAEMENENVDAVEAYLDIILKPSDPRSHISFFSKLQDVCMEALTYSTEDQIGEIPYETLTQISLESTLPYFDIKNRTLMEEINRVKIVNSIAQESSELSPEEVAIKKKKIAKTAFICSICIMTFLEAMKTMHLIKPSINEIRNYVDKNTDIKDIEMKSLSRIEGKVNTAIDEVKKTAAMGALGKVDLENNKLALENAKKEIEKLAVLESEIDTKNRIIDRINNTIISLEKTATESLGVDMGYFATRMKEENLASLTRAITSISRKPNVMESVISVRSSDTSKNNPKAVLEMTGVDAAGNNVASHVFMLHCLESFGSTAVEVLRDCAQYVDLGNKPISIYFTDSAYKVPLKD